MPRYRLCSWRISALHSHQGHCSNAIRLQNTDVYLCQTDLGKPQTTSANTPQTAEVPLEGGIQAWSFKFSSVTRNHEPHFPCNELKQICLTTWSFKFMKKKDSNRRSKKQIWKKQASIVTDQRLDPSKFAKKLTRMPPCRHWLHWWHCWSAWWQIAGPPLCTQLLAL